MAKGHPISEVKFILMAFLVSNMIASFLTENDFILSNKECNYGC